MTDDLTNLNPEQTLAVYADGELDGELKRQLDEQLTTDPAAAKRVENQRKLRESIANVMADPSYQAPTELRDKIAELARTVPSESSESPDDQTAGRVPTAPASGSTGSPVFARIGRWIPSAVAAVLLIGAFTVFNAGRGQTITTAWGESANVLNASLVHRFAGRHVQCSRNNVPLEETDRFPKNFTELPVALSEYLHTPVQPDALDFSKLGYVFDVAGLCVLPGKGAVHILYHAQSTDPAAEPKALSLWLRPYPDGAPQGPADMPVLETDTLYASPATEDANPMVIWRHGGLAYYLVGDDYDTIEQALDAIRQEP